MTSRLNGLQRPRWGFTLLELMLSLGIVGVITVALCSAIVVGAKAWESNTKGAALDSAASRAAADQITADIRMATSISEQSATAITMSVPDRDGDGAPETIRYSWSGTSGAALMRQYNGAAPVSIANNVRNLNLLYTLNTIGAPPPSSDPGPLEGSEQILASYYDTGSNYNVSDKNWPAEYFKPVLPADAVSWKITRIKIQMKKHDNNRTFTIQVRKADAAKKPTGAALESVSFPSNSIPNSATWVEAQFSALSDLSPNDAYVVLVTNPGSGNPVTILYDTSAVSPANIAYTLTTNKGSSWSTPVGTKALNFYVYGTVTTSAP